MGIFALMSTVNLNAQVTIGCDEAPVSGSLLQIKEVDDVATDAVNAHRGLALPRVALSDKNQLYPMFLKDPDNPASGPNAEYAANKAVLDKTHTGLIVYNITENESKELCVGLNQWDGEQWQCFTQKPTTALFTFDCNSIEVFGNYGDGVALTSANYIRVSLTVTRVGSYTISAISNPDNGYFFETTGNFLSTGTYTITVPGMGEPIHHTCGADLVDPSDDTPDLFTLTSSGSGIDCSFSVNVISTAPRPEFNIECGSIEVEGMYFEDTPLSAAGPNGPHRIKVKISNISPANYGAIAVLQTNTVDGFSFRGETVLSGASQTIYLNGTGIPRGLNDKLFTITSNSMSSTSSCEVLIYMLIPRKRLMTLGNTDNAYGYNAGLVTQRVPPNSLNTLLTDKDNFGYNQWSILKFAGFHNLGTAAQANFIPTSPNTWVDDDRDIVALETATWQNMSNTKLRELLFGTGSKPKIDVFMIGYSTNFFRGTATAPNTNDLQLNTVLVEWCKAGGILMICSESSEANRNFMNLFFNGTTNPATADLIGSAGGAQAGSLYTLGFNLANTDAGMRPYYCRDDDPILRGPFEDILGRNWGEDASQTMYLSNLPLDRIVIYSGARPIGSTAELSTGVTIFRSNEYPLIFIGDGGFNSAEARSYQNTFSQICPFTLTSKTINGHVFNNYPNFRLNFGPDSQGAARAGNRVYNTSFTANAFAWCILKAEEIRRANKGTTGE